MNVFKKFTETINENVKQINKEVDQINQNINNTMDNVKDTLGIVDSSEADAVLSVLRNGRKVANIEPDMIKDLSDEEARQYILRQMKEYNINIFDETLPMYSNDEPSATLGPLATLPPAEEALIYEDPNELLQEPQISGIFNEIRSEFPEITPTPVPPSIAIEGFEDVPLSTAVRVNDYLKQQFLEKFNF